MTRKLSPGIHIVKQKNGAKRKVRVLQNGQWRFLKGNFNKSGAKSKKSGGSKTKKSGSKKQKNRSGNSGSGHTGKVKRGTYRHPHKQAKGAIGKFQSNHPLAAMAIGIPIEIGIGMGALDAVSNSTEVDTIEAKLEAVPVVGKIYGKTHDISRNIVKAAIRAVR